MLAFFLSVDVVPWLVIHGGPISGEFSVEIANRGLLQLFAQAHYTPCCHVMLDGPVDEAAPFAWLDQAIERANPLLRLKVKGPERFLYRAVDSGGQTIDFRLTAKRDAEAAKRFFRRVLVAAKSGAIVAGKKGPVVRLRHG